MNKVLLIAAAAALLIGTPAEAQVEGIVLDEPARNEMEIVVTGTRPVADIPLAYEAYVPPDRSTFSVDLTTGNARYEFVQPVYDFGNGVGIDFYSAWSEDPSDHSFGSPERSGRRGRLVYRW